MDFHLDFFGMKIFQEVESASNILKLTADGVIVKRLTKYKQSSRESSSYGLTEKNFFVLLNGGSYWIRTSVIQFCRLLPSHSTKEPC